MNRNVEIKAKVTSLDRIERCVQELADEGPTVLEQEDTFFNCPDGRLKLRRLADRAQAELIYYQRSDAAEPKESRYAIHRVSDPDSLVPLLSAALGVRGVVRKRRTLYRIGATRVHLDCVAGMGQFVELEVVLEAHQSLSEGVAVARDLMSRLAIPPEGLLRPAYIDLLESDATCNS